MWLPIGMSEFHKIECQSENPSPQALPLMINVMRHPLMSRHPPQGGGTLTHSVHEGWLLAIWESRGRDWVHIYEVVLPMCWWGHRPRYPSAAVEFPQWTAGRSHKCRDDHLNKYMWRTNHTQSPESRTERWDGYGGRINRTSSLGWYSVTKEAMGGQIILVTSGHCLSHSHWRPWHSETRSPQTPNSPEISLGNPQAGKAFWFTDNTVHTHTEVWKLILPGLLCCVIYHWCRLSYEPL